MNAAKRLVSHFDSFRGLSSVKEFSCTGINTISDLAGSPRHGTSMQTEMLMDLMRVWIFFFLIGAKVYEVGVPEEVSASFHSPHCEEFGTMNLEVIWGTYPCIFSLAIVCIFWTTGGMRAPSMACKHLLWHLISAGITDI